MFSFETTKFYVNLENVLVYIDRYYVVKRNINLVKITYSWDIFSMCRDTQHFYKVTEIRIRIEIQNNF